MLDKYKSYEVYNQFPTEQRKDEMEIDAKILAERGMEPTFTIVGDPIDLKDYYKEIGYDYKKKKFDGMTIQQIVKRQMESSK